jgi:hypothetical protein
MVKEVLTQMVGLRTSASVWKAVIEMFSSQSQALVVQLHTRLNQCRKENKSGQVYLDEIKGLSDKMTAAGKPLDNLDVISHILSGLDPLDDCSFAIHLIPKKYPTISEGSGTLVLEYYSL